MPIIKTSPTYGVRVSESGVVYSTKRGGRPYSQFDNVGYKRIKLKGRGVLVHRIVADAFIGPSDLQVNHKDGVKTNNHWKNLEYATNQQNVQHAYDTGLNGRVAASASVRMKKLHAEQRIPMTCGTDHYRAILTPDAVRKIRESKGKLSNKKTGEQFGVSEWTVKDVRSRKTWRHIE